MIVELKVTQEDIDNGERSSSNRCPVAIALKRALPDYNCAMGLTRIIINGKCKNTPKDIVDFVTAFDNCLHKGLVKPFELTFSI